jgi:hypothetical protein
LGALLCVRQDQARHPCEGPAADETSRSTSTNQRNNHFENKISTHSSLKDKRKLKLKLIFSYLKISHEFIGNRYRLPL